MGRGVQEGLNYMGVLAYCIGCLRMSDKYSKYFKCSQYALYQRTNNKNHKEEKVVHINLS